MIALQEELDWDVYSLYGLLTDTRSDCADLQRPELMLGERAFEIVLAGGWPPMRSRRMVRTARRSRFRPTGQTTGRTGLMTGCH